ncbi:MAG TPA: hypothetical protein VJX92_14475 [Methylomirabilota bacterium]|nr:hypothetical protein [Methylomirabilota bacterium]
MIDVRLELQAGAILGEGALWDVAILASGEDRLPLLRRGDRHRHAHRRAGAGSARDRFNGRQDRSAGTLLGGQHA